MGVAPRGASQLLSSCKEPGCGWDRTRGTEEGPRDQDGGSGAGRLGEVGSGGGSGPVGTDTAPRPPRGRPGGVPAPCGGPGRPSRAGSQALGATEEPPLPRRAARAGPQPQRHEREVKQPGRGAGKSANPGRGSDLPGTGLQGARPRPPGDRVRGGGGGTRPGSSAPVRSPPDSHSGRPADTAAEHVRPPGTPGRAAGRVGHVGAAAAAALPWRDLPQASRPAPARPGLPVSARPSRTGPAPAAARVTRPRPRLRSPGAAPRAGVGRGGAGRGSRDRLTSPPATCVSAATTSHRTPLPQPRLPGQVPTCLACGPTAHPSLGWGVTSHPQSGLWLPALSCHWLVAVRSQAQHPGLRRVHPEKPQPRLLPAPPPQPPAQASNPPVPAPHAPHRSHCSATLRSELTITGVICTQPVPSGVSCSREPGRVRSSPDPVSPS